MLILHFLEQYIALCDQKYNEKGADKMFQVFSTFFPMGKGNEQKIKFSHSVV